MKPSLKERFEQLERVPAHARGTSGSAVALVLSLLHPPGGGLPETISATRALVHGGMDVLKAKRVIEGLFDKPEAMVDLPMVEDTKVLIDELAKSGIRARVRVAASIAATIVTP
jgi:hypothetical protein